MGTSGGELVMSGGDQTGWRRPAALTAISFFGIGLMFLIVNASSQIDEWRRLGRPIDSWYPWTWEVTSFVAWLVLLPLILKFAERLAQWEQAAKRVAAHLVAAALASVAHTSLMTGLRQLAYAWVGETYRLSAPMIDVLVFELRKDLAAYALVILVFTLFHRMSLAPQDIVTASPQATIVEVRDGSKTMWIKADHIEWIAAAGNYVELHGRFGTRLARRTLAELSEQLSADGFVQIHRSRLVRRAAVTRIDTRQSGDFDLILQSGAVVGGSRRYRAGLA